MGCLVKLLLKVLIVLVLLAIGWGGYGTYLFLAERAPTRMTCREFLAGDGGAPRWLTLTDCELQLHRAVRLPASRGSKEEAWFVPARPAGGDYYDRQQPAKLVVQIAADEDVRRVEAALAQVRSLPPGSEPPAHVATVRGLVQPEVFRDRDVERAFGDSPHVVRRFALLRQDARPRIVAPGLALLAGAGAVWLFFTLRRWGRRPEPGPAHEGPLPPPEVMLAHTRQIAGPPPRQVKHFGGLFWPMPQWLRADEKDPLRAIYADQEKLLARGQIVWGTVVQANASLSAPGDGDAPAAVIYSTDPFFDAHPEELVDIADGLFFIKGEETDADLATFSRILEDEVTRAMRLEVPRRLTGGREVIYTSIVVRRIDLPDGYLADATFPLLVLPAETSSTLIVPWEWWSPAIVGMWRKGRGGTLPPPPLPASGRPPLPVPPLPEGGSGARPPMKPPPLPRR